MAIKKLIFFTDVFIYDEDGNQVYDLVNKRIEAIGYNDKLTIWNYNFSVFGFEINNYYNIEIKEPEMNIEDNLAFHVFYNEMYPRYMRKKSFLINDIIKNDKKELFLFNSVEFVIKK